MFSAAASSSLLRLYVQPTRNLSAIIMDIFQGFVNDTNTAKLWLLLLLNLWGCWLANWKWGSKLSCSCLSAWWSVRSFVNNLLYFDIGIWKYSNSTLFSLFLILINYWFINLWAHLEHKFSGLFLKFYFIFNLLLMRDHPRETFYQLSAFSLLNLDARSFSAPFYSIFSLINF